MQAQKVRWTLEDGAERGLDIHRRKASWFSSTVYVECSSSEGAEDDFVVRCYILQEKSNFTVFGPVQRAIHGTMLYT